MNKPLPQSTATPTATATATAGSPSCKARSVVEEKDFRGMTMYRVTWTMDVDARTVESAAKKARTAQVRRGTWAKVFEVEQIDDDGPSFVVDLNDLETSRRQHP